MELSLSGWIRGFTFLLWLNAKHYFFALWGLRLRLDPDYPAEARFRGDLIVDSVLEYRGYGLFVLWCPFLALICPKLPLLALALLWASLAFRRSRYYSSPIQFWTRAYNEAPLKHRNRIRYFEEISREIERQMKAGAAWDSPQLQALIETGNKIQNVIIERKR